MNLTLVIDGWLPLSIAIIFSVIGTLCMKISAEEKSVKPALGLIFSYVISFVALTFAIKYIDLSIVYAVWSGVGTILVYAAGVVYFNETLSLRNGIFLFLIIIGVVGIHLGDGFTSY